MPRKARLQSPTDYYHVMMRGNNKEKIFTLRHQKDYFLDCMKTQNEDGLVEIVAYCVMDNHVHLVVKADLTDLSTYLKKINTRYAMWFNYQHDRVGHVFQGRYISESIYDDTYLLNVIRYVHNNPVKAKIVYSPTSYAWSSYNEFIKVNDFINYKQKDFVLNIYGSIDKFIDFHRSEDTSEYLDTKEELEELRFEVAQKIISIYFRENGINDLNEIKNKINHIEEIARRLIKDTKLSNRQISNLLNINRNVINEIKASV